MAFLIPAAASYGTLEYAAGAAVLAAGGYYVYKHPEQPRRGWARLRDIWNNRGGAAPSGRDSVTVSINDSPLLYPPKDYRADSVFTVENMIEAGRNNEKGDIPAVCVLDPDGEILKDLQNQGERSKSWPCPHTDLWVAKIGGRKVGIVPFTIGSPFAVFVADELYACGCQFVIHFTSAKQVRRTVHETRPAGGEWVNLGQEGTADPDPFYVLIESALRDEGASVHWQPPSIWSHAPSNALAKIPDEVFKNLKTKVSRGKSWTTDSLHNDWDTFLDLALKEDILCVEMESAALYAFANNRGRPLVSFAQVQNESAPRPSECQPLCPTKPSELIEAVCNAWFANEGKSTTRNVQSQGLDQMGADKSPLINDMHADKWGLTNLCSSCNHAHPRTYPHDETPKKVPEICVISPERDILGDLRAMDAKEQKLSQYSKLWVITHTQREIGFVPNIVGGPFAVLTADMLFERGCKLVIHLCNGAEVANPGRADLAQEQSFFVLVEEALRDEGTSLHWQPPSTWSATPKKIIEKLQPLTQSKVKGKSVVCGRSWTLDCPFRETKNAIELAKAQKVLCMEMESAALRSYANANAHLDRDIVSFVMVQNSEADAEDDDESGMNDGPDVFLELVQKVADKLR